MEMVTMIHIFSIHSHPYEKQKPNRGDIHIAEKSDTVHICETNKHKQINA